MAHNSLVHVRLPQCTDQCLPGHPGWGDCLVDMWSAGSPMGRHRQELSLCVCTVLPRHSSTTGLPPLAIPEHGPRGGLRTGGGQ